MADRRFGEGALKRVGRHPTVQRCYHGGYTTNPIRNRYNQATVIRLAEGR